MTPSSSPPVPAIVAQWNMALQQPEANGASFANVNATQGLRALICNAADTISVPAASIMVPNWDVTVNSGAFQPEAVPAWVGTNTFSCNLPVPLPQGRRMAAVAASEEATEAWTARELHWQQVQSDWRTFVASTTVLNTQSSYSAAAAAAGQAPATYMH